MDPLQTKRKPDDSQACRYCGENATRSLVYGDGQDYLPCCSAHEGMAKTEIRRMGRPVLDRVAVNMEIPSTWESRMARALEPAPTYPEPDENSRFGMRVSPRMARSALSRYSEADIVSPNALPIRVVSNQDVPDTFMKALGTDWKRLHALRVNNEKVTVTIDGQKFSVFSRRG